MDLGAKTLVPGVALVTMSLAGVATAQPTAGDPVNPWQEPPAQVATLVFVPPHGDPIDPWWTDSVPEHPAAHPDRDREELVDPWRGAPLIRRSGELLDPWADEDPGELEAAVTQPPTAAFPLVDPLEGEAEPDWKAHEPGSAPIPESASRAAFPLLE